MSAVMQVSDFEAVVRNDARQFDLSVWSDSVEDGRGADGYTWRLARQATTPSSRASDGVATGRDRVLLDC
jgi:hypothetical protein